MSIIALFVSALVIIALFVSSMVSVVASGAPGYYIGFLTPRDSQIVMEPMDHRVGMLTICEELTISSPVNPVTLQGVPAVIAPSYMPESVTVMAPIVLGDHRDAKGRFMPRYKA